MAEHPDLSAELPEAEPAWFDRLLSFVNKRDRRTVTLLVLLIGLGGGSFTVWATVNTKGEGFVDERIDAKVGTLLDDHGKPIKLSTALDEQGKAIAELQEARKAHDAEVKAIGENIAAIKQAILDMKEQRR